MVAVDSYWTADSKINIIAATVGISRVSVMQCNKFLREVCTTKLLQSPIVLGAVVQVDESLFSHKVKAHCGHLPNEQVWVFGIVDNRFQPAL